ncbi:exodeoxyribonuclease V subunit alpha [Nocardioides sp. WL0053]|uniref:RecBCD enzyme subunit RecD n=1 Tax=Nocardioides jiangsuensis TaxID=2866161 RepID=A0ABS7RLR4_9ACTN|nr:exodeoxyribonuclease V subunit alpha [Nocardioides jiangsuensis]MBY9075990.1 exodeoxyribonuclease V subunit alpha [Nocardioides jiangsuensis]
MTELFEITEPFDRRLALGATGMLRDFNQAGVLTAADVHVARRLGELTGEADERVLLAAALATRAVRHGSVCLDLATVGDVAPALPWPAYDAWVRAVSGSALVSQGVLRWEFDLLYLDRYWHQEVEVCADLGRRLAQPPPMVAHDILDAGLDRVFGEPTYVEQRAASRRAATQWTTVLTGGPGTGKTTTVAGLLALLAEQAAGLGDEMRVALTAPTGKAAARLKEAVAEATARLAPEDQQRLGTLEASTLHRLLGSRRDNGTRFRHHRANRLPHDVIVVDETSMVSLTMMTRLVEAVRPDARLILVGDADQLASVDAGAVLSDLVTGFGDAGESPVVRLATTHRFGKDIGRLAAALRDGSADDVVTALQAGSTEVEFVESNDPASLLRAPILAAALAVRSAAEAGLAEEAVAALDRHRLLCAHREGPYGVRHWNRQVEHWLAEATGDPLYEEMYVGRPLMVTANDYGLGVYNGDAGVVVREADGRRAVIAGANGLTAFATSRMSDVETMFATTIHKSQGSQADEVTVLLPPEDSRLLTRELFYTAVTRAKKKVRVVGSEESVRAAVERRAQRASGLRQRLHATGVAG